MIRTTKKPCIPYVAFILFFILISASNFAQIDFIDVANEAVFSYGESGQWDDAVVWNPAVIKDGDTLRMWYTGHNENIWTESTVGKIGYAWSMDGIHWHRYSKEPVLNAELEWEDGKLFSCAVIKDGDTFKMWYGAATALCQSGTPRSTYRLGSPPRGWREIWAPSATAPRWQR